MVSRVEHFVPVDSPAAPCAALPDLSRHRLEQLVAERTRALAEDNDRLRRALAEAERANERAARLQIVTARLSEAVTTAEVGRVALDAVLDALGGFSCAMCLLDAAGTGLELVLTGDVVEERGLSEMRYLALDADVPAAEAARTGELVWLPTREASAARYPALRAMQERRGIHAWGAVPLLCQGRVLGSLALSCQEERPLSDGLRELLWLTAQQCAQALERARLYQIAQAARAVAERAQRSLATTLRSIGEAVIATDAVGVVTFMNPVAETLTGWSLEQAEGAIFNRVFRLVSEGYREPVDSLVDQVIREGAMVGPATHGVLLARDGRETAVENRGALIRDDLGRLTGVVLVFRDVSAERRRQVRRELLTEATAALGATLDYRATLTTLAQLAVPRLADWCTVDIREEGRTVTERLAVAHVDPSKVAVALELDRRYPPPQDAPTGVPNVLRTGRSELYPEIPDALLELGCVDPEHLRLSRALRLRSAMVVPLPVRGRTLGAMTLVFAESGRHHTAEDLAFAEELARRAGTAIDNAWLFASEQEARLCADASNQAKDDFLATVSHELRTPLTAILGWTRLLQAGGLTEAKRERALETIERNALSQAQLIDDLLDVSRIVSGKLRLESRPVDLAEIVEEAARALAPALEARQLRLRTALARGVGPVFGDATRLQQVVWNLLSNAIKFTAPGKGVELTVARCDAGVRLEVADEGQGVSASFLPFVFDRFKQGETGSTRSRGGLGLGLSIARQLVEMHGGTIEVRSPGEGLGATFTVTLPLGAAPVEARPAAPRPSGPESRPDFACPPELHGLELLVVDDEPDARELLAVVLERCGARVTAAASVREALAALTRRVPQALVSDLGLPGEDGYALIRQVRALPPEKGGRLPAIALTAYARAEDRRKALDAGFTMHVPKPVEPAELVAAVAALARFWAPEEPRGG